MSNNKGSEVVVSCHSDRAKLFDSHKVLAFHHFLLMIFVKYLLVYIVQLMQTQIDRIERDLLITLFLILLLILIEFARLLYNAN